MRNANATKLSFATFHCELQIRMTIAVVIAIGIWKSVWPLRMRSGFAGADKFKWYLQMRLRTRVNIIAKSYMQM